jgi:hypothetical protein
MIEKEAEGERSWSIYNFVYSHLEAAPHAVLTVINTHKYRYCYSATPADQQHGRWTVVCVCVSRDLSNLFLLFAYLY